MFEKIQLLPEICAIKFLSHQQKSFLLFQSMEWYWVGKRLDYLFAEHSGTRPLDPLKIFHSKIFDGATESTIESEKEDIRLKSNYLFALFLIFNEHWQLIQLKAKALDKDFKISDPLAFFIEVCRQISSDEIVNALNDNPETVSGTTISNVRNSSKTLGKFCRGTHPEQEKLTIQFLHSPCWGEFALAAVSQTGKKYLRNSYSWQRFLKAHKEQERLATEKRICLEWNQGIPINSQNKKRF